MVERSRLLELKIADSDADIRSLKRLRYEVFVNEFGISGPFVDHAERTESDNYDDCADHLVVIDQSRNAEELVHVIASYRLLRSEVADSNIGFYCQTEFDLTPLLEGKRPLVELGRLCVHPDYRNGLAVFKLWQGVANYVLNHDIEIMFGTASFVGTEPDSIAEPLSFLYRHHLAPDDIRVVARPENYVRMDRVPGAEIDSGAEVRAMPSLISAYLRRGGYVGKGAYIDTEFNTIDVCLLIDTLRMPKHYRRYYVRNWGRH